MKILVIGASGFIGQNLYRHLQKSGYEVSGCQRSSRDNHHPSSIYCDMNMGLEQWQSLVSSFDLVINCVGIFQPQPGHQDFEQIHHLGPVRLFKACEEYGVKVIQISAIGSEQAQPMSEFLQSKKSADDYLLTSSVEGKILYPGVVLGNGGKSSDSLCLIAHLPIIPLLFPRSYRIPIISINQLVKKIILTIEQWPNSADKQVISEHVQITELFNQIRMRSGLTPGSFISCPDFLTRWGLKLVSILTFAGFKKSLQHINSNQPINSRQPIYDHQPINNHQPIYSHHTINSHQLINSLQLLKHYNQQPFHNQKPSHNQHTGPSERLWSVLDERYLNRIKQSFFLYFFISILSFIWCWSGGVSLFNPDESLRLVQPIGLNEIQSVGLIYAGAMLDLLLGILIWWEKLRRSIIQLQIIAIMVYSFIIAMFAPEFYWHPYAPVIKNLALLGIAFFLLTLPHQQPRNPK